MPDTFWNGLFAAIVTITLAYLNYRTRSAVDRVAVKGQQNADAIKEVHAIVNGQNSSLQEKVNSLESSAKTAIDTAEKLATLHANLAADRAADRAADHRSLEGNPVPPGDLGFRPGEPHS